MIENLSIACEISGFHLPHAQAAQSVAERVNCIILFREPGPMAQGLIADGYAMKGFRVDTKSCNWGPMSGFVCMDPRLTKDEAYLPKNRKWTHEALSGEINENFFGKGVKDPSWVGDVMPIVISQRRIDYLKTKHVIDPQKDNKGHFVGVSKASKGSTVLPWRLIPIGNASQPWLKGAQPDHCVLCIDTSARVSFTQELPEPNGLKEPVERIQFRGFEAILGLTNPGSKHLGFKACVTADYDLFAIWPGQRGGDLMDRQHFVSSVFASAPGSGQGRSLPGGVKRMVGVDSRLKESGSNEHHRFGDVSARTMNVKALLNSAIQNPGGNAVHHNDEAGNFALAKGTLKDCLPIIGFVPSVLPSTSRQQAGKAAKAILLETLEDFKTLVLYARENNFREVVKAAWLVEAGV